MKWRMWFFAGMALALGCEQAADPLQTSPEMDPSLGILQSGSGGEDVPDGSRRYIVRFERSESRYLQRRNEALNSFRGTLVYQAMTAHDGRAFVAWFLPEEAERLRGFPGILDVTEDEIVLPDGTRTVNDFGEWGLDRIDQRTGKSTLDSTYTYFGDGTGVHAYVVDTGVDTTHSEFAGPIGTGHSVDAGCGPWEDNYPHGIQVASVLVGQNYGVAPDATLHSIRVTCSGGAATSALYAGLDWVLTYGSTPGVVNFSWHTDTDNIRDLINDLWGAGIPVVVSAGNQQTSASNWSSNTAYGSICVAGSDDDDDLYDQSNYGSAVDLVAPGDYIRVADTGGVYAYDQQDGTSFSAPFVAGTVALMLEEDPYLTPSEVRTILTESATQGKLYPFTLYGTPNLLLFSPHLWANVDGPVEVFSDGNQSYSMSDAFGANGSYSYAWYYRTGTNEFGLVSTSATYVRNIQEDDPDFDLKAVLTSAGLTFQREISVKLCWNDGGMQCEWEN